MRNGKYKLSVPVELRGMDDASEALKALAETILEYAENDQIIEGAVFELVEEFDPEYDTEEDTDVEELNFDKAV